MASAQTTTAPATSQEYWQTIQSVNSTLTETITMASDDFLATCELLKKCNVKGEELKSEISAAVRELQHIDFLRQKLGHIRDLHSELTLVNETKTIGVDDKEKYSMHGLIFKINYHQLMAAHEDYIKVVLSVQSTIRKIKEHNILLINFNAPIFSNRFEIDDNFRNLGVSLESLARKYHYTADADLSGFASEVSSRYTMESERIVLDWCVSNTTGASDEEFLTYYKSSNLNNDIELF